MEAVIFCKGQAVGWNIRVADTFLLRLIGLLGRKKLNLGEGLLLIPCRQVHTWFMKFPIDVVFLDEQARILAVYPNMAPWKISPRIRGCWQVLELSAGSIKQLGLKTGSTLDVLLT